MKSVSMSFCCSLQLLTLICSLQAQTPAPPTNSGQVSSGTNPANESTQLPVSVQMKKTVAFLETDCLHDYNAEISSLKHDIQLQKIPVPQQFSALQQVNALISTLQNIKPSAAKLSQDEKARLNQNLGPNLNDAAAITNELIWRADILIKMTDLTKGDIAALSPETRNLLPSLPVDQKLGTGFFVMLPDARLPHPQTSDKTVTTGFTYLVTNRHVVEPGADTGKECRELRRFIMLNRKPDATHPFPYAESVLIDALQWTFSSDDSVDLAVAPIGVPDNIYDFIVIGTDQFIADGDVKNKVVVEGDPVMFTGLFIQSFSQTHRMEPIVRSGSLAMVPDGLFPTTMNKKPGRVFLTEAHAFGGNSGSPVFIDTNKFRNIIGGPSYRLLGVISGEVFESADLSLNVTTSISGSIGANSDVSMVVPATEILQILQDPKLKADREAKIPQQPPAGNTDNPSSHR